MEYEIKRFNLLSAAKILFIIFLVIGILLSMFYMLIVGILGNFMESVGLDAFEGEMIGLSGAGGFFIVLFLSIFYSLILTALSLFMLVLYNIAAGFAGGIKFNTPTGTLNKPVILEQTEPLL